MIVDVAVAQRPARGELICGDVARILTGPVVTLALADGLGHGPLAAEPARGFCEFVAANPGLPLDELFRQADRAIASTRGAAAAIARIDTEAGRMEFAGIGNVLLRAPGARHVAPFSTPGIVGRTFRKCRVFDYPVAPGLLLIMHSDGISSRAELEGLAGMEAREMAQAIVERFGVAHDDVTCVVARCR